jgi:hypothetical protein
VRGGARWRGEPLEGKRLLLRAEEGLGDTIHFSRYAAALTGRGARVTLLVQPALELLFRGFAGAQRVGALGRAAALGAFDYWSPLLSVPRWLGATPWSTHVPYLYAEPARAHRARRGGPVKCLRPARDWKRGDLI